MSFQISVVSNIFTTGGCRGAVLAPVELEVPADQVAQVVAAAAETAASADSPSAVQTNVCIFLWSSQAKLFCLAKRKPADENLKLYKPSKCFKGPLPFDYWFDYYQTSFLATLEALPFCPSPPFRGEGQNGKALFGKIHSTIHSIHLRSFAPAPIAAAAGPAFVVALPPALHATVPTRNALARHEEKREIWIPETLKISRSLGIFLGKALRRQWSFCFLPSWQLNHLSSI